jgi:hypothetical protein
LIFLMFVIEIKHFIHGNYWGKDSWGSGEFVDAECGLGLEFRSTSILDRGVALHTGTRRHRVVCCEPARWKKKPAHSMLHCHFAIFVVLPNHFLHDNLSWDKKSADLCSLSW